jgi:hypothetical protein
VPVRVAFNTHVGWRRNRYELVLPHRPRRGGATRPGTMLVGQYGDAGPTPPGPQQDRPRYYLKSRFTSGPLPQQSRGGPRQRDDGPERKSRNRRTSANARLSLLTGRFQDPGTVLVRMAHHDHHRAYDVRSRYRAPRSQWVWRCTKGPLSEWRRLSH